MRGLLDVNFIIAMLDADHAFHERAHNWWAANSKHGWASCPITENGVVRIISNPNYSKKKSFAPSNLIDRLQKFVEATDHDFWSDEISIRDKKIFTTEKIHGSRQLTDFYLLALATKRQARLVTLDQGIPLSAVVRARADNLCVV
jgi:toxin-antitoxin system PIN domain toxin